MNLLNSLGMAYSDMGDDENAVNFFKKVLQHYPASVISYNNLGRQYIKMEEYDRAIEILERGLKVRDEPHLRYNLAKAKAEKTKK